jgi:hypothetical protein
MRYPSKELIKNITPVARTMSEAYRDAEYCMAIQTFKSDVKLTIDFLWNALMGFLIVGIVSLTCFAIVMML